MQPKYSLKNQTYSVEPVCRTNKISIEIDGKTVQTELRKLDEHSCELFVNGKHHEVFYAQDGNKIFLHLYGKNWQIHKIDEFSDASSGDSGNGSIFSPMPGIVIEVNVSSGQAVEANECLMLIESMKLQTELKAPIKGTVGNIAVADGQSFDKGMLLIEIISEPETGAQG
jgi:acetyl/propionyl-CoA carboxylase alpha subunit